MAICDICSNEITGPIEPAKPTSSLSSYMPPRAAQTYTPEQFRACLSYGLAPIGKTLEIGTAMGLERWEVKNNWTQRVKQSNTNWVACQICAENVNQLISRAKMGGRLR